ncbi:2-hydroxychromene-2-carboxylate isomerase [Burkholderia sp. IMCC1007]|uniref:2-hydroxychromene-2-carboxylate isomerase n=1 Tax=Burkholderia sp. IMCC1007 TaxID=3004104 RepID=UPI0022B480C7|nr:2-hydroxychromene-2-carboxylate isomerase [Burkholderia sp. IMCC1007]
MNPIVFYFDFVSPYAYLASNLIDEVAQRHGRSVQWLPFRLGVTVVKVMGLKPILDTPLKAAYVRHDVARMAKASGLPLTEDISMFDPVPAQQVFYAAPVESRGDLASALLRARWANGLNISDIDVLTEITHQNTGVSKREIRQWVGSSDSREAVRNATNAAIARGVFGSPTFVVGAELFWGVDRLPLLDRYLINGESYGC